MTATDAPRIITPGSAPADNAIVPPMFPGGMLVDEREADALAAVIARKCLFRYYGPGEGPREVKTFEEEWCAAFGSALQYLPSRRFCHARRRTSGSPM